MRVKELRERVAKYKDAREDARRARRVTIAQGDHDVVGQLDAMLRVFDEHIQELEDELDWRDRDLAHRYKEICERDPFSARRRWGPPQ